MDIDIDSPFSPGSASDLSDLFEPPSASPPSSALPKISRHSKSRKSERQKTWQNILGGPDSHSNGQNSSSKKAINSGSGKMKQDNVSLLIHVIFSAQF